MPFKNFEIITHGYTHTTNDQLKDFIYARQEEMYRAGREMRDKIETIEQLEEYKKNFRAFFLDSIGGLPDTDVPLNGRVTKVTDYEDYKMEQIIFQSRKDTYVTGSMYIPHGAKLPGPGVLFVCGHANEGRMEPNYQMVCATIARAGLIVFAVDPIGQGERLTFLDPVTHEPLHGGCTLEHDGVGIPGLLCGTAVARNFLADEMRAVDYMLSRPELIDPERIGMTGNSGGGTQTTVMMMMDDRIKAAAPGTFFSSREEYMYAGQAQDAEQIWPGFTGAGHEHVTALLTMAPRPVCILATKYDFYPIEGTRESVKEGRRFYEMYGKPENLRLVEDKFTHRYTPMLARAAGAFFSEIFLGKAKVVENNETFHELTMPEMFATKSGQIMLDIPDASSVYKENVKLGEELRKARLALPTEERLARAAAWLREKVNYNRRDMDFNARIFPREHDRVEDGFLGTSFSWYTEKRLFNFGLLVRPEEYEFDLCRPTVIAVWDGGSRAIGAHENFIRRMNEEGKQVFVLDVSGVGDVEQAPLRIDDRRPGMYTADYGTLYKLDCDLIYTGDSMPAMRVYDVLRCLDMLRAEIGLTSDMMTLYCDGEYGVYGTMAAFLDQSVGVMYGDSLVRSAEKRYLRAWNCPYEDLYSLILPGMLQYFDYEEIMR